jgi:hypothetical protein
VEYRACCDTSYADLVADPCILGVFPLLMYNISKGNTPNLRFVIWTSSAFFGIIHMGNYTYFDYSTHFYWVPLMIGAQFLVGLVLSYIRLNHGMKWAIIFHAVYNAVLIIPAIYFYKQ